MTLAYIQMLETLKTMVDANLARFTVIPAFAAAYADITTRLTAIQAHKLIAVKKTNPQTEANLALKIELSNKTVVVANTISALAGKLGDVALKEEMNVKAYKLKRMAQGVLVPICQNIHTKADANKVAAADYLLTQGMLDELQDLIDEYSAEVPEVRTERGEIDAAKALIEKQKGECEAVLTGQLDPMVNILQATDPGAVDLWRSARVVIDPQSTPTQVKFKAFYLDNGVEMPSPDVAIVATAIATNIDYFATTDELGEAQIKPIPYGMFDISAEAPGFLPFSLTGYKMVKGKVNKVDVVLVPAT